MKYANSRDESKLETDCSEKNNAKAGSKNKKRKNIKDEEHTGQEVFVEKHKKKKRRKSGDEETVNPDIYKTKVKKSPTEKEKSKLDCMFLHDADSLINTESKEMNATGEEYKVSKLHDEEKKNKNRVKQKEKKKLKSDHESMEKDVDEDEQKVERKPKLEEESKAMETIETTNQVKRKGKRKPKKTEDENDEKKKNSRPKKVRFAEEVKILNANECKELIRGKRFTPEEDKAVKQAVLNYIDGHDLGDEGLHMVLNCKKNPKVKNCWKEISAWIPHRPLGAVYSRAHSLFERDEVRKWTDEELETVRKFHEKHGAKWKQLAEIMGKQRVHIKDCWRRICNENRKRGQWGQEEYQKLFDLVNLDLQTKVKMMEARKTKHGMLRDDIPWTAICEKLETRSQHLCCLKWYQQLTSPMVVQGTWSDSDDYRMVKELYERDDCCAEDVEWDDLVDGRSGHVCRLRWLQMVKHAGNVSQMTFRDQLRVLTERYCPSLLHARSAFESLPLL